jgi:hypothetical protein
VRGLSASLVAFAVALIATGASAEPLEVSSIGRRLNVEDWSQTRLGQLIWRGGLELTSPSKHFGGFSGLLVESGGKKLTAVTDRGMWFRAELVYDGDGVLSGLQAAEMGALKEADGRPTEGKSRQDAEAMAHLHDGSILVAFEQDHRLARLPEGAAPDAPPVTFPAPQAATDLPNNLGLEALAAWPDGRILAATENREAGAHAAFLFTDGQWQALSFTAVDQHRPTGADVLPNGDLLLLERRYSPAAGLSIRLRRVPERDIRQGARIMGEEIARFEPPLTYDNMEALAVWRDAQGRILVALLSDDNFNILQRTLLLLFEIVE